MSKFREIVVHIGQHKTGSTRIQSSLAANATNLLSQGVFYPLPSPDQSTQHALVWQFRDPIGQANMGSQYGKTGDDELILAALEDHVGSHTAVLSSEDLLNAFKAKSERFLGFDARLSRLADRVRYIAYVRNPVDRFPSSCSQVLMNNALLPATDWAFNVGALVNLRDLVGERFEIRVYDRNVFVNRDVMNDFASVVLGIDVSGVDLNKSNEQSNISLSAEGMFLVQAISLARQVADPDKFLAHDEAMKGMARFIRRFEANQEDRSVARLKPEMPEVIVNQAAKGIIVMREKLGIEWKGLVDLMPSAQGRSLAKNDNTTIYRKLVRNVFHVDAERVIHLSAKLSEHRGCSAELKGLLNRIQMPSI